MIGKYTRLKDNKNLWTTRSGLATRGNFPLNGLVFYAPLFHQKLNTSPFLAWDIANGSTHSCTVTNATWGTQGRSFTAASTADRISVAASSVFNMGTGNYTVVGWAKSTAGASNESIFGIKTSASRGISLRSNAFTRHSDAGIEERTFTVLSAGVWTHLAGVYDNVADTISVYKAGAFVSSTATTDGSSISDAVTIDIGAHDGQAWWFGGTIGEVLFFNRALTAGEILHLYLATRWRY